MGDFHYSLSKGIAVMSNIGPNNEIIYVLPSLEGHYGIVLDN